MNVIKEIQALNDYELSKGIAGKSGSWHDDYKDSSFIFIGNIDSELTEGDIICVFSQYGEIFHVNLVKNKETGESKGFGFIGYEDQRSTVLAVDNMNGVELVGKKLRVDHVKDYKPASSTDKNFLYNAAQTHSRKSGSTPSSSSSRSHHNREKSKYR